MRYVVIMAGGSGTRLWPLSRRGTPKQLLELFDGKSLLRLAYERLQGWIPDEQILVCTSRQYLDIVAAQLPELAPEQLLGEPVGRDSLGAVAWSAAVLQERDPDAVVAMVTADQLIEPVEEYQRCLSVALDLAESDPRALVTLGVVPDCPHTGYGYLEHGETIADGVCRVARFREKPPLAVAQEYVASGKYWWNAGIFVWRASTLLRQLDVLLPDAAAIVRRIAQDPSQLDDEFAHLPKLSVDYGVMEPVSQGRTDAQIYAVGLRVSWSDVGGYASLARQFTTDEHGNQLSGITATLDAQGCLLINACPGEYLVSALGMRDTLIVVTPHGALVAPIREAERVKELVEHVRQIHGEVFT